MTIVDIASICHAVNKRYCETLGDYSQKDWDSADEWQQQSAIKGVRYRIDNPDATSELQHKQWCIEKERNGWIYGKIKDPIAKTHPCLLTYADLPIEQQLKDRLFIAIVDSLKDQVK